MHEKYSKEGVVAVSVSLDDAKEKDIAATHAFLKQQRANFTNLLLDESQEFWQKRFDIFGPPCVYVFDRQGKWTRFKSPEDYKEINALVASLLAAK